MEAVELARDVAAIAEPTSGSQHVVTAARLAEAVAHAAAPRDHAATGRAAAECLYHRRCDASDDYVVAEAALVLFAGSRLG